MQYKHNSKMVAHLWANKKQESASNSGNTFYFDKNNIYSYGTHFLCASITQNKNGQLAYLITNRSYSSTTSKHMCCVKSAIPSGSTVFHTNFNEIQTNDLGVINYQYVRNLSMYIIERLVEIDKCVTLMKRSRTANYMVQISYEIGDMLRWIKFWGLSKKQKTTKEGVFIPNLVREFSLKNKKEETYKYYNSTSNYGFHEDKSKLHGLYRLIYDHIISSNSTEVEEEKVKTICEIWSGCPTLVKDFEDRRNRHNEKMKVRSEERGARYLRSMDEKIQGWRNGENNGFYVPYGNTWNALLRIKNGMVETSKGISIDISEASRLWPIIKRMKITGNYHRDLVNDSGSHQWVINSFENDILTVGCHSICYSEIEQIAIQLGLEKKPEAIPAA